MTKTTTKTDKNVKTDKPVKEAKPSKKASKQVVETPVAPPAVVDTTQTESGDVVSADVPATSTKLVEFGAKLQQISALLSSLRAEHKMIEKSINRELKAAQKGSYRRKRSAGNRQPSGFVKPSLISDELALFLGKEKGSEMARVAVSKEINGYIKAHKLQDSGNGRKINPDAPLAKLLGVGKDQELTYFNLQRFLKHHFVKA